jgi:hypothetical protein
MINRSINLRNLSVPVRLAGLVGVALLVLAIVGPVAVLIGGSMGLTAAALAAATCLAGAVVALLASQVLVGPGLALASLLVGMTARMAIPLVCGLVIHLHGGPLADAGILYYLVMFYPVTLAAETLLSLPPAA